MPIVAPPPSLQAMSQHTHATNHPHAPHAPRGPPPVLQAMSQQNRKTLTEMSSALKKGGMLIWVAPSGGRDRLTDGR